MRKLIAFLTIAWCLVSCDKSEPPQLPAAQIAPQIAEEEVETCPDSACEAACAKVEADIQKHCPDAWVAGCFAGTAPKDYPCKLFLRAQETPQPAEAPAAVDVPTEGTPPDDEPRSKARRTKSIQIEGVGGEPAFEIPTLDGESAPSFFAPPGSKKSLAAPKADAAEESGDDESSPEAKPTPFGD